jgi:predicted ATPase
VTRASSPSAGAAPAPLGAARSRFVGREREIDALAAALASSRLVTVAGTAGVGKTRLALEYVEARAPGAVVVADLTDARTLADVVAAAHAGRGAAATSGPAMLLLDGCEGVVEHAAAHVAELLARAPPLRCLATSRRPLGLAGERILQIEPLALPLGPHEVEDAPSSALFLDRAIHEVGALALDDAVAAAIADICQRLGGLPLAIELCARRLRVMSVTEIAQELARGLDVLGSGHRDAAPRHQSLRAALAVSWEMLSSWERAALAQASVFRGWFTLAAAEQVIDLSGCPGAPPCVEVLQALVDHSLVGRAALPGASVLSFRVYEGVRHFAAAELGDAEEAALDRHEWYFLNFLHRHSPGDGDDLVAALRRALFRARPADPACQSMLLSAAFAANAALAPRGAIGLRLTLLDAAIASSEATTPAPTELTWALLARAQALSDAGRAADARVDRRRAEELARRSSSARLHAALSLSLAAAAFDEGRVDEGAELADALALLRALGDRQAEAEGLILLARAGRLSGDLDAAKREAERAASVASAAGAPHLTRLAAVELGHIAHDAGDVVTAQQRFDAALAGREASGDAPARALSGMALLRIEQEIAAGAKALEAARAMLERSLRAHRASGSAALEAEVLGLLGLADELDGHGAAARVRYEEAAAMLRAAERAPLEGLVLASLGRLLASSGRLAEARAALDEARARLFATGVRSLATVYDLCEAHLSVAEARAARGRADERATRAQAERARRVLATDAIPGAQVRLARILLARDLSDLLDASPVSAEPACPPAAPGDALVVSASGRWFSPPHGPRVSLTTRHALRLILRSLADQRETSPGTPLDVAALLRAGWPGEHVLHDAGTSRVYTAVAQLRREGLRDILQRRDDGYLLDPHVAIARAAD